MRDYLNEGGKLILRRRDRRPTTGCSAAPLGGIYYGLDGAPKRSASSTVDPFSDCLLLADDFTQYYLGACDRDAARGAAGVVGTAGPMAGDEALFGGPATVDNPIDEAGAFTVTSDVLPPDQFPQFASDGRRRLPRRRPARSSPSRASFAAASPATPTTATCGSGGRST